MKKSWAKQEKRMGRLRRTVRGIMGSLPWMRARRSMRRKMAKVGMERIIGRTSILPERP